MWPLNKPTIDRGPLKSSHFFFCESPPLATSPSKLVVTGLAPKSSLCQVQSSVGCTCDYYKSYNLYYRQPVSKTYFSGFDGLMCFPTFQAATGLHSSPYGMTISLQGLETCLRYPITVKITCVHYNNRQMVTKRTSCEFQASARWFPCHNEMNRYQ